MRMLVLSNCIGANASVVPAMCTSDILVHLFQTVLGCACVASNLQHQQILFVCSLGSARGWPGSTYSSIMRLDRCNTPLCVCLVC